MLCERGHRQGRRTVHILAAAGAVMLAAAWAEPASAVIRYVNVNLPTGANDGTSWENAFRGPDSLQNARAIAVAGDEIWTAQGIYKPTTTATRTIAFNLKTGVAIYGGFASGETALDQRDFVTNVTTLSGDLLGNDSGSLNLGENSYHVVNGASATSSAILDGFTITAGNANGADALDQNKGGGMIFLTSSNGTVRNCLVINNRCTFGGGAGYIRQSSPAFVNTTFQSNIGGSFGGAFDMFNLCNPSFNRCSFISNTAARAGGVEVFGSCSPTINNCVFRGNSATGAGGGGAMFIASTSTPTIRCCTFNGNTATQLAAGILSNGSTTNISNCIVYGNTGPGGSQSAANQIMVSGGTVTATYTDVQGGFAGLGNINMSPLFVNAASGDLHLADGSPCIDAGNNATVPAAAQTGDRDNNPRFVDDPAVTDTGAGTPPLVDMGAYEHQLPGEICVGDVVPPSGDGEVNIDDLFGIIGAWGTADPQFDVAPPGGNGVVDIDDLFLVIGEWGSCA